MVETAIKVLSVIFLVPAALISAYYVFLVAVALAVRPLRKAAPEGEPGSFAIVIPAHNEEDAIGDTLRSCLALDYPKDKYTVYCIADNCTDSTASVARQMGAVSLERHDLDNRGKGFALEWAFERILPKGHDAVVVLDADCTIDSRGLRIFDSHLKGGADVLQASYVTSNPDESPISYASAVGNVIENVLFYAPKSALGLAVFLRGTGMAFKSSVLKRTPWSAHSIAEDVEYGIRLLEDGYKIRFIDEVRVLSKFPATVAQLKVQRERWAGGNLKLGRLNALRLFFKGIVCGRLDLMDAGWTFLALSRPLVLLMSVVAFASAGAAILLSPSALSSLIFVSSSAILLIQAAYFMLGIVILGISWQRAYLLLKAPAVVAGLAVVALRGVFGAGGDVWVRTPRA
ncbi:MAG: glycosyltransferase family 2 protein [Deltaproteobacteria bacterium]